MSIRVHNWKRSITYEASCVAVVSSVRQIAAIVRDSNAYPSPVRARGSHHSTTRCIVAEGGTVIDMRQMNRILEIDKNALTITMEAGVWHIDAAKALEKLGLQFYVNVEIGNLTIGSGACGATKDASYISQGHSEWGQVGAYCIGVKVVQADGEIVEWDESSPEMMTMLRSSYGMLGIVVEATYRVKPIVPLAVEHVAYSLEEFVQRLDELLAGNRSMMMYLFPFLDKVVVEYRFDGKNPTTSGSWQWKIRNWVWKTGSPGFARAVTTLIPWARLRSSILNAWNRLSVLLMTTILRGCHTSPADQIILYPETAGFASYTFSIWAFAREEYGQALLAYYRFCKQYYEQTGYRCDLLNVGYSIAQDQQSIFSYSRDNDVLTIDPVSTGAEGWPEFLDAYNEFCSRHNGIPLFNQTGRVTPEQAQKAFAEEIVAFSSYRQKLDPACRFYPPFFRELLETSPGDSLGTHTA